MPRREVKKLAFLEAYNKTFGNITQACKAINAGRRTYYLWMKKDPVFVGFVKEANESFLDMAESKLHEKVVAGEKWAIELFLSTHGKDRGYGEEKITKLEHTGDIKVEIVRKTIQPVDDKPKDPEHVE